ncbi:cobyrinate a,c-diamide synthase [Thermosediminibacter oceani]|uniref:Cobyrinate a,c-diamide synthase n=1 Tax=Thermosediminibacter oceani (strain ATCC BAA-1034 / DSM 16646 / JW/IW-1228P) TaxID=555079 RepID=D9S0S5_THEOJ|nr:cobyrinate a,c-diamide synthase [Thermosediminibacter oceani]ADL07089.1 hydrogenobyrinic acid a,c-diamide synthase (glutamine-hydrolysing); cobyrinate a,c-diamide synthase [Thermosediminibacter oceani DSM 16646]
MARGIMIAGTHSGSGKTTVSLGLMGAMAKRHKVIPFKVGPDYIDTAYHRFACGNHSYNLDAFLLGEERLKALYAEKAECGELAIAEGVMGFFDGMDSTGFGSSAHVAGLLSLPVILVVDASGMARSVSAMVKGFRDFDPGVRIAGVILNRVGGERHYALLKECIERDTGIPAVGFLPEDPEIALPERHLGLVPVWEMEGLKGKFERLFYHIERCVDLEKIWNISADAGRVAFTLPQEEPVLAGEKVRIALALDEAFNFYYRGGLELFENFGAELVPFSPLKDSALPEGASGIYIGGGFPEIFAGELSRNRPMLEAVKKAVLAGMPVYAECGGLMYLSRAIVDKEGRSFPMVEAFDMEAIMTGRLRRFGYARATVLKDNVLAERGTVLCGHEFHHSEVVGVVEDTSYLVEKPGGRGRWRCGFVRNNCLATYLHIDFYAYPELVRNFLNRCRSFCASALINEGSADR